MVTTYLRAHAVLETLGRIFVMNDEVRRIRELSNTSFYKMLKLVELGLSNWWTASSILSVAYDNMTEEQKRQIRRSYEERFEKEFPDIESFLELGRKGNKFETFFSAYENHVRFHKSNSAWNNRDSNCIICELEQL
jgi:hypothetical protein